jgi:hypothetical protein
VFSHKVRQQTRDRRVKIHLASGARGFESVFNLAMANLLGDGQGSLFTDDLRIERLPRSNAVKRTSKRLRSATTQPSS